MRKDVQKHLQKNRDCLRKTVSKVNLPNFIEGGFVLVARSDVNASEKLCLGWRGPRRITNTLNDFVYQVQDLHNGTFEDAHISRLKFFSDSNLNIETIMPHVLLNETGMSVSRLMKLVMDRSYLKVIVRWRVLPASEDTREPVQQIFGNVPILLQRLLKRKNTPRDLVLRACKLLRISKKRV